ncbi:MAG: 30S ribosomal protein S16 [Bacteroidia bacterium]|nr:30S ribosomal protein S16 [Bacteroidia bacterium]
MPVRIRLARHGKKKYPYYHIVIADSRAPRDGRLIERIGSYNPNSNPATIELNFDRALKWIQNGAQPSDTCRALLSQKGVMFKNHLLKGIAKGAITEEISEQRFTRWLEEKEAKIQAKKEKQVQLKDKDSVKRMAAETKKREAIAEKIAKKNAEVAASEAAAEEETQKEIPAAPVAETTEEQQ